MPAAFSVLRQFRVFISVRNRKEHEGECSRMYSEEDLLSAEIVLKFVPDHGWEFLCMVQGDNETDMTRMYIHR